MRNEKGQFVKGSNLSPKTQFKKGQTSWNKGKKGLWKHTEEWRKQSSERIKKQWAEGKRKIVENFKPLSKHSEETKKKISEVQREKNKNRVPDLIKQKEREWKKKIRQSWQWKDWRMAVFERDKYTCKECGAKGVYLEPHHIIPIRSDESKLFEITNGITLCRPCHRKTVWKEEEFLAKYLAIITA